MMCKRNLLFPVLMTMMLMLMIPESSQAQEQDLSAYKEALTTRRNGGCGFFTGTPSSTPPTCNGGDNGQACITITGGVGPFTYFWIGNPSTTNCRAGGAGAGTYTVIVTDLGQGSAQCAFDVPVTEPAAIGVFTMNPVPPTCFGLCNGQANPLVTGGTGMKTFLYSSGETTQLATMLCDPFSLTITDANGCTADTIFDYTNAPLPIDIVGLVTDQQCAGVDDGTISITVTGGSNSFGFQWTGPALFSSTDEDLTGLTPGVYELTVTDSNSCAETASFEVLPTSPIVPSAIITDVVCAGEATGAIDHSTTGGTGTYSFEWSGPNAFSAGTEDITGLFAGIYNLEITDSNLCIETIQYEVEEDAPILLTALITDLSCFGDPTGAIDLTVTGTFPVSSYQWTGPSFSASSEDITGLFQGLYTVNVENSVGCLVDSTFEVLTSPEIVLTATVSDLACFGDSDGTIELEVSGGDGTYGYQWVGPPPFTATTQDISSLAAGAYSVNVTDGLFCSVDSTFTITEPDQILVTADITDVLCNGEATGSIEITVLGGVGPYNFVWNCANGLTSTDEDIFDLSAGICDLTLTDQNGCVFTASYVVQEPSAMVISAVVTDLLCFEDGTGAIDITVTGGTPLYTLSWTGPLGFTSTDEDISGLQAGTYIISVTDANGCIISLEIDVNQPDELLLTETHSDITCFGANDGMIDLTITGGTGTPDISWTSSNVFTSNLEDLSGLSPGVYTVLVTDENGCTATLEVTIQEPLTIIIVGAVTPVACFGDATGAVNITVSNGVPTYLFDWTGPGLFTASTEDIAGLMAGTYTVIVTDQNGCTRTASFIVPENPVIDVTAIITDVACNSESTGAIDISISGGQPPYSASWTGPTAFTSTSQDITDLEAGSYLLTVTDAAACVRNFPFIVNEEPALVISGITTDPDCAADANGSIDITVTGGTLDYTYAWTGPLGFIGNMEDLTNRGGGNYTVTVTDFFGCSIQASFTLVQPSEIVVTLDITDPACDMSDGSVQASVDGGTVAVDYTYQWFDMTNNLLSSTNPLTGQPAGNYVLIVTDDNGCTNTNFFELSDATGFVTAVITNVTCLGASNGAINTTIGDLVAPWTVSWIGPAGFNSTQEDISGLVAGGYTITIIDALGCSLIQTFTVGAPPIITLGAVVTHVTCVGSTNGAINLSAQGGTGTLTYSWSGPGTFSANTQDLTNLASGTYNVVVTDNQGCTASASFIVNPGINYQLTATLTPILCAGQTNGAIDLMVSPNIGTATYQWTGVGGFNANTQDLSGLNEGVYDVIMTTPAGCTFNASFTITAPSAITVATDLTPSACGMSLGAVMLTANGGTVAADYTYSIFSMPSMTLISSTNTASGLDGGLYSYTVTDDNGCIFNGSFVINDSVGTLTASVQDETCQGAGDGAIDLTVTGLALPLTVQWSGPNSFSATTQDITGLAAGLYTVSVTGSNGCVLGDTYTVMPASGIVVNGVITQVSCAGDTDGAINITPIGGVPTLTYAWTGPGSFSAITQDISSLAAGNYTVIVTDGATCTGTATFTVNSPDPISVNEFITGINCFGNSTGAISIDITGGNGTNMVSWSGPGTFSSSFEDISDLVSGAYDLLITDSQGCEYTDSYFVPQAVAIDIALIAISPANCSLSNGSIQVIASGGVPGYGYVWTNSIDAVVGNAALASNLPVGTYTVTITDGSGCQETAQFTVNSLEASLSAVTTGVSCFGGNDGSIDLTITGVLTGAVDTLWTGPGTFMATSEDITGLVAGAYTITLTDEIGCIVSEVYTVTQPTPITSPANITHVSCNGINDGAININQSGGTGALSATWTGPGTFTAITFDISALFAGTYTVTLTDANDCEHVQSYVVNEPDMIIANEIITHVLCFDDNTGSIDISPTGGTADYTYHWTGPGTFDEVTQDITGLFAGTYTLEMMDQNDCLANFSFEVLESPEIQITLVQLTDANCGLSNGSIEVIAAGGDDNLNYAWANSSNVNQGTGVSISGLPVDTYTVTVTDGNMCSVSADFEIENLDITVTASVADALCFGSADGSIDLTVVGSFIGTVDTLWTGPGPFTATSEDISGLISGSYTVTLTDDVGCVIIESFEVLQPTQISSPAIITDVSCNGFNDGAIVISPAGGTGAFTATWTGPGTFTANTLAISNLFSGTYIVTLTDANNCTYMESYEVDEPSLITAPASITSILCNGDDTGAIDISPAGGVASYFYHWTGPGIFEAFTQDISGLIAGTYNLEIRDQNDCVENYSYEVLEGPAIFIDLIQLNNTNCGLSNGSIEVAGSGGTGTLSYEWQDENDVFIANDTFIENLAVGTYTVYVTDGNLCVDSMDYEIQNQDINVTAQIVDVSCFGLSDGAIDLTVQGAFIGQVDTVWTGPLSFNEVTEDIQNLIAGQYTITLSDAVGCIITESFDVAEPELLVADGSITGNLCFGDSTGSIISAVNGGTLDYTYSWTGPGTFTSMDPDISDLAAGTYILTITDDHDCIATFEGEVTQPALISPQETLTDPSCLGNEDGSITLEVIGGTGVPLYSWTGPGTFVSNTEDLSDLGPGTYVVEISDENNCMVSASYTLTALQVMDLTASSVDIPCNSDFTGSIDVEVNGGLPNYAYAWTGPTPFTATSQDITGLEAGTYALLITDLNGCELDTLITLTEPDALVPTNEALVDLNCNGDSSGAISLDIEGGIPGYIYAWTGPGFSAVEEDISGLAAGEYFLDLIDGNGCMLSLSYTVAEPTAIDIVATSISNSVCENSPDGAIAITISGGIPSYGTSWSGPDGFSSEEEDLTGILPGTYTLTVTDDHGCVAEAPYTVTFQLEIMADAGSYDPICNGETVTLDGTGSTGASSYAWTLLTGTSFSSEAVTTLQATVETHVAILTITNGLCVDRDTVNLDILLLPIVDAGEDQTTFLDELVVLGGNPTAENANSFTWFPNALLDDPSSPNPIYVNTATQTFSVTVVGNNGCIATDEVTITLDPSIEVPDGFTPNGDQVNDQWMLGNKGLFPEMVVQVFSRWGDELFKSAPGYPDPWNGEFNNSPLPVGTYYYIILLNDPQFPDAITGPLTIFR